MKGWKQRWEQTLERAVEEGEREYEESKGRVECYTPKYDPEADPGERSQQTPLWSLVRLLKQDPELLLWGWQKTWRRVSRHFGGTGSWEGWPPYIEQACKEWEYSLAMLEEEFYSHWHQIEDRSIDLDRVAELSKDVEVPEFEW